MTETNTEFMRRLVPELMHLNIGDGIRLSYEVQIAEQLKDDVVRLRKTLEEILELSKQDGESRYLDKCYVVARNALEKFE